MSETTAFLAGSAVAGVAALLMLKSGGISLSQPEVMRPYGQTSSAMVSSAPVMGPTPNPVSTNSPTEAILRNQLDNNKSTTDELKLQLEQQKFLTEQLKQQLEQQRDTTAQLKSQLDNQRQEATGVIDRLRDQQRSMDMLTLQQALPRNQDPSLLEQAQLLQTLQQNHTPTTNSAQVVTLAALGGT
jgi:septal ring factor EnvC (AmiA/AmiB activator)